MDILTEEINKKHGFLYKIDGEYYYMGCHVFEREDDNYSTTISKYNEYLKFNNEEDMTNVRELFRTIMKRSDGRKNEDKNIVLNLDEFIKKLDKEQYDDLKQQVNDFVEFYKENVFGK
jgi:predicted transcriptional regulator YdeE